MLLETALIAEGCRARVGIEIESVPAILALVQHQGLHGVLTLNGVRSHVPEDAFHVRPIQPGKGPPDQSTIELANQFRDGSLTPAAAAAQKELAAQIESAVHLLRDNDREIILMRHYEQLDNQEIAQALGLSEPAASMRYLRALKRLREIINSMPRLNEYLQE
jgi:RNA polymerase sigma-70 factor (ECF subfamily)